MHNAVLHLVQNDVERLAHGSSVKARVEIATKVAESFTHGRLTSRGKDIAIDIFRLLVRDAQVRVRTALAHALRFSHDLPHEIAMQLAQDVQEVALPMLEHSSVLNEEDLLAIVQTAREISRLVAISRRKHVSEHISDALLDSSDSAVMTSLFANKGAVIREERLLHAIKTMTENESVMDALLTRTNLPLTCVEKIFLCVSEQMKQQLAHKHAISRHLLERKFEYAHEWATLGVTDLVDAENVDALVIHLKDNRRLTSSIVVRALCAGDLRFFETAMAQLAGISHEDAQKLLHDAGGLGFKALYKQTPLPPDYCAAVQHVFEVTCEIVHKKDKKNDAISEDVVENIVAHGYDTRIENMPILLAMIKGNAGEFA